MKRAIVIPADGPIQDVALDGNDAVELAELQSFVGGYIQMLTLVSDPLVVLFCNEDGKGMGLPHNARATAFMRSALFPGDFIVGNLVICGRDGVETMDLPADFTVERVKRLIEERAR